MSGAARRLRGGVTYDVGCSFLSDDGATWRSRPSFDPQVVAREMRRLRDELNCQAVRVVGGNPDRMELAATRAAEAGLEVWWSPWVVDPDADAMLAHLADTAERCERLRARGHRVVMTTGAELSLTMTGFLPGATFFQRIASIDAMNPQIRALADLPATLNAFLAEAVRVVRERFDGPVAYPSLLFEGVDWTPFDFVSADFFPSRVDGEYRGAAEAIRSLASHGKPVAITEIGCSAYVGADAIPGRSGEIIAIDLETGEPTGLRGDPVRDESVQAEYLVGLLDLLEAEGVEAAFVCTLAQYQVPGHLDTASWGIARMRADDAAAPHDVPWEPKEAFRALAERYGAARRIAEW